MARIKDGELYKQMRARAAHGLSEAIIALRHIDYDNPAHHNMKTIEHGVRAVEYFFQLSKDIEDVNRRLQGYKAQTKEKGTIINALKKGTDVRAALPSTFFNQPSEEGSR